MSSLLRTILIGLAAALCAVIVLAVLWWFDQRRRHADTLASRLPASAVLAYISHPDTETPGMLRRLAPALPPLPAMTESLRALAAVRTPGGTEGWIAERKNTHNRPRFTGTSPDLETILSIDGVSLDDDPSFRRLRWHDDDPWMYLAFPDLSTNGSSFERLAALTSPLAVRVQTGVTLRFPLSSPMSGNSWTGRSLVTLPDADILALPSWDDLRRIGTLLTPHARMTVDALARGFVAGNIESVSLDYDLSPLLKRPSLLHLAHVNDFRVFALEGNGKNASDTERIVRFLHERVASSFTHAETQTINVRGHTLTTLLPGERPTTTERTDGGWTILETRANGITLLSIHNGTRFALTNYPEALTRAGSDAVAIQHSVIRWSRAEPFLRPLLPTLEPIDDVVTVGIRSDPGILEWSFGPLQSL